MVLVFLEDPADELSRQALAFARGLGQDPDVHAIAFDGPYAPAAWGRAIARICGERDPQAVVAPGSDRGNEVLAHAAAALDLPLAVNCVSANGSEVTRIRWGGSLLEEATVDASPLLLTVAPHAVEAAADATDVERVQISESDPVTVAEHLDAVTSGVSLSDAAVVVSGGRGVGSAEGFAPIEELAQLLGGAVGCSRAVTSAGWRPHTDQVGQTGTKIAPEIYIACGISGATQHMAGCKGAKKLLAINPDAEASILANADYAVIGDLHEVVPAISSELRRARGS